MLTFYTFLLFGTALAIWGSQTRGTMSQNISIIGGLIWLVTLVTMFFSFGVKDGFIALFVSFAAGAVCKNIFPKK